MYKIFEIDKEGFLRFSKTDLEKILDEAEKEGFDKGYARGLYDALKLQTPYYVATSLKDDDPLKLYCNSLKDSMKTND